MTRIGFAFGNSTIDTPETPRNRTDGLPEADFWPEYSCRISESGGNIRTCGSAQNCEKIVERGRAGYNQRDCRPNRRQRFRDRPRETGFIQIGPRGWASFASPCAMTLLIDNVAKDIARRRWALPECLHVPVAAADETAIAEYVGKIERVLAGGAPTRALLVRAEPILPLDPSLPISKVPASAILHLPMQVWVHVRYPRYRSAYKKAFPDENIAEKVLSHAVNRRMAEAEGFQYVRITPATRSANSSSAFSEQWGVNLHGTQAQVAANKKRGAFIRYADLCEIMLLMDMGGDVMEAVNVGQRLVRPSHDT